MAESISNYPLCWPAGWKRSSTRKQARFSSSNRNPSTSYRNRTELSVAVATKRVMGELGRMGIGDWNVIISTNLKTRRNGLPYSNQKEPNDPGVAVYWKDRSGQQRCMAVDIYDRVADNLGAIAATLEAMRAIERHGGAEILERAFLGFQALPPPVEGARPWWEVLGFHDNESVTLEKAEQAFRELSKKLHPDLGGDAGGFAELADAIRKARQTL